jgi:hypothetical protein
MAILTAPPISSIVRRDRPLRIESAGAGFYEGARDAEQRFAPPQIGMDLS